MKSIENITSRILSVPLRSKLAHYGILHLAIFWSYARGEADKTSDLDILIDLSYTHGMTLSVLDEIEMLLKKELSMPSIDIVTMRSLNPRLKPYIEKDLISIF